jgi:uncharacterized protein YutE (UPF0331/DUF86 family)
MASSLHSVYNGIEKILLHAIANFTDKGNAWHSNLLVKSVEENLITAELEEELRKLMGFRHFFRHSYGFMLDNDLLKPLYSNISNTIVSLKNHLEIET